MDELSWTPRKPQQIRKRVNYLLTQFEATPSEKLMLRKMQKAIQENTFERALIKRKEEVLEAKMALLVGTKRKRVDPDPNSKFADIRAIRRSQRAVGRDVEDSTELSSSELSSEEESDYEDEIRCS